MCKIHTHRSTSDADSESLLLRIDFSASQLSISVSAQVETVEDFHHFKSQVMDNDVFGSFTYRQNLQNIMGKVSVCLGWGAQSYHNSMLIGCRLDRLADKRKSTAFICQAYYGKSSNISQCIVSELNKQHVSRQNRKHYPVKQCQAYYGKSSTHCR